MPRLPKFRGRTNEHEPQKAIFHQGWDSAQAAPARACKPSHTVRIVAYVTQASANKIDAVQVEQGCTAGQALDILLAS